MESASRIRTAVIPAAGQGTRMLPATKAVPKELLPILEQPALQLVIDEAVGAGVDHIVIVTSAAKPAIEGYFARTPEVEEALERQGRHALADRLRRYGNDIAVSFVHQDEPRGLGHAVGCARSVVGDRPFFVMLPDELMEDSSLLLALADLAEDRAAVALKRVPVDEVTRYGVVNPVGVARAGAHGEVISFDRVVEKPVVTEAPSDLVIIGRYAFTPDIFSILDELPPAATGEIQLSDALTIAARAKALTGLVSTIGRRDIGNPVGWLEAVVDAGLAHTEYGRDFEAWLHERLGR
ncbi:MAG: UTP--glucose-1-phosphate uridylyltransferase [Actinomycetota bacterium]